MTQDEIIEMPPYLNASYEGDDLYTGDQVRELMKLVAAKAAAKEREACAKIVEESSLPDAYSEPLLLLIAEEIRERGEQT